VKLCTFFYQARPNHAPKILGVQGETRPKHVKWHASGVQFSTPRACCTTLIERGRGISELGLANLFIVIG